MAQWIKTPIAAGSQAQGVKRPSVAAVAVWVEAAAWIQYPAQELLYALGAVIKIYIYKKGKKKEFYVCIFISVWVYIYTHILYLYILHVTIKRSNSLRNSLLQTGVMNLHLFCSIGLFPFLTFKMLFFK